MNKDNKYSEKQIRKYPWAILIFNLLDKFKYI